jgi:hypothetical protein
MCCPSTSAAYAHPSSGFAATISPSNVAPFFPTFTATQAITIMLRFRFTTFHQGVFKMWPHGVLLPNFHVCLIVLHLCLMFIKTAQEIISIGPKRLHGAYRIPN